MSQSSFTKISESDQNLPANAEHLYAAASRFWEDIYGVDDKENASHSLSRDQLLGLSNRNDLPESEREAAKFVSDNFAWLADFDGQKGLSITDVQIFVKSIDAKAPFDPYYREGGEREHFINTHGILPGVLGGTILGGSGMMAGMVYLESAALVATGVVGGLAIGVGGALLGQYLAGRYYDKHHGAGNYYEEKRHAAEKNGGLDALSKVF